MLHHLRREYDALELTVSNKIGDLPTQFREMPDHGMFFRHFVKITSVDLRECVGGVAVVDGEGMSRSVSANSVALSARES